MSFFFGWNQAGYLPVTEPYPYDEPEDAVQALIEELTHNLEMAEEYHPADVAATAEALTWVANYGEHVVKQTGEIEICVGGIEYFVRWEDEFPTEEHPLYDNI